MIKDKYTMRKILLGFCLSTLISVVPVSGQDYSYRLKAGFNIGGTSPLPIPSEVKEIKKYSPTLAFALGGEITRNLNDRWGIMTGLRFETKGMTTNAKVENYKITLDVSEGDNTGHVKGYFTGDVKTKVRNEYLTIPVVAVYNISPAFEINGGLYMSMRLNGEFSGKAYDSGEGAYIRDNDPTGEKIGITSATYDFSRDLRKMDFGFQLGTHWNAYRQFSLYADFTMSFNSIFPKDYDSISFGMYNIYLNLGFAYNF